MVLHISNQYDHIITVRLSVSNKIGGVVDFYCMDNY